MAIRQLQVKPVTIRGAAGFQVQCLWSMDSDSMYEQLAHAAVFRCRQRAERFLARIKSKPSWNWDWSQWGVPADCGLSNLDYVQAHAPVYSVL
jgi:hypothetical protein